MVATCFASKVNFGFHMSEPYAKIQKGVPGTQGASASRSLPSSSVGVSGTASSAHGR